MIETDSFEVFEEGWDVKCHQTGCQEGGILKVQVVRIFLNKWSKVCQVDLLEE